MITKLDKYIALDLVKVGALALVAFTLVMTVLGIIEPLREEGLGSGQVVALFAYTLPWMLSLTLPVAALFAGTIVYGRFSQDNELTACKASGVSTMSLLKPALVLGVVVTVMSMALSNYVAPKMTELLARSLKANAMAIVARKLRMQNYYKKQKRDSRGNWRTQIVHADAVYQKGNRLTLYGVVAAEGTDPREMRILVAPKAHAEFAGGGEQAYVSVYLYDPVLMQRGGKRIARAKSQPFFLPVPNPSKEKPSWYNWNKLMRARVRPEVNSEIRNMMKTMRREMCHDIFHKDVLKTMRNGAPYDKLRDEQDTYVIRAPEVKLAPDGSAVVLKCVLEAGGAYKPVEVVVRRDGRKRKVVTADSGRVWAQADVITGESFAAVELIGLVRILSVDEGNGVARGANWASGRFAVPEDILNRGRMVLLDDMIKGTPILGRGLRHLPELKLRIEKLRRKILAQIHSRLAFGLSCFVLVGLGAALGLIFRGGQVISAFAILMVPGAIVLIMVLMGKNMVSNLESDATSGIAIIWGPIVGLLIAKIVIYARLARQ